VTDDEAAEADHVQVVVLDALVRGERFVNEARANARHLICGNAGSHSAAANGHTPIHFATRYGARQTNDKIGIVVVGLQPVVSEVDHMTARVTQPCGEMVLQVKAAMVRGKSDPRRVRVHSSLSRASAGSVPPVCDRFGVAGSILRASRKPCASRRSSWSEESARIDRCSTIRAMKTSPVLRKLIRACVDDERTLRHESQFVDASSAVALRRLAREREHFVADLERLGGCQLPHDGSWTELSREAARTLWVAAAGRNNGDALATCRHSLARTEALYDEALQASWPDGIRFVLASQRLCLRDEAANLNQLQF